MVLTLEQQDAVWERWRAGEPVRVIARTVRCTREAVRRLLAVTGGIRPAARSRAPLRLSLAEREEISRGLAAGDSARYRDSPAPVCLLGLAGDCPQRWTRAVPGCRSRSTSLGEREASETVHAGGAR